MERLFSNNTRNGATWSSNHSNRKLMYIILSVVLSLILIIGICVVSSSSSTKSHDDSRIPHSQSQPFLEIVYLIDRTTNLVLKEMPRLIRLSEKIAKDYTNVKFGITLFADFMCNDWTAPDQRYLCRQKSAEYGKHHHHQDPEGCYTFNIGLTHNLSIIETSVLPGNIPVFPSGGSEAGLAGLMMTAAERKMGWTTSAKKYIILITDDSPAIGNVPYGNRHPPKGDGTDSCMSTQNPTLQFTGNILKEKHISVFMLLTNDPPQDKAIENWIDACEKMGVDFDLTYMRFPLEVVVKRFKNFLTAAHN